MKFYFCVFHEKKQIPHRFSTPSGLKKISLRFEISNDTVSHGGLRSRIKKESQYLLK